MAGRMEGRADTGACWMPWRAAQHSTAAQWLCDEGVHSKLAKRFVQISETNTDFYLFSKWLYHCVIAVLI